MKYKWRTRPYAHQVRAVKFALRQFNKGLHPAFLMEPRTGKTKTTIDTLCILHKTKGLRKAVVIAPNRVLGTWVEEFAIHAPIVVQTIVWDAKARKMALPPANGAYDMQVILVNYEAFGLNIRTPSGRSISRKRGRFGHKRAIAQWIGGDLAAGVLDESHKIKSPSGKAANMVVSMRDLFSHRFLLTGTPVTKAKRAHDVYMQWQWLNPNRFARWGSTVADFKYHIGRWRDYNGIKLWVGPRETGMEDLRRGIHADSFVVTRDACLDLPKRMPDRIIPVTMNNRTAHHYDEMAETMITQLENGEIAEASIPLVVALRLLQITSGYVGVARRQVIGGRERLVSVPHRLGKEKLIALKDVLIEEVLERDEKVVVAARFKPDLNAINKLCAHLKIKSWAIRGGMTRDDSDQAIRDFRRWDDAGVMVVQPQAAGLGIDLSTASHMVWYSVTPSWVDFSQCCDRIALSRKATTFSFIQVPGTVDQLLYEVLQEDGNIAKMIMKRPEVLRRVKTC